MAQSVKNRPAMRETRVRSLGREDLLEEGMSTTPQHSRLQNPHGQRSLEGYSPRGGSQRVGHTAEHSTRARARHPSIHSQVMSRNHI